MTFFSILFSTEVLKRQSEHEILILALSSPDSCIPYPFTEITQTESIPTHY